MNHLTPRSIVVGTRRTTVRLEAEYWEALRNISRRTGRSIRDICTKLDEDRHGTLASQLRLFVLDHLQRPTEGQIASASDGRR
jgi:predicted DNA-binding ribbon-helix-helix protein